MSPPAAVSERSDPQEKDRGAAAAAGGVAAAAPRPSRRAEVAVVLGTMAAVALAWAFIPKGGGDHAARPAPVPQVTTTGSSGNPATGANTAPGAGGAAADEAPLCVRDPSASRWCLP